jgi:hypothetical protein
VTDNRREKQLARERQEQLGCSYTAALRQIRAEYDAKQHTKDNMIDREESGESS